MNNSLSHYGIKGQKWGVRNYQYKDGTYTPEGLERYFPNSEHNTKSNKQTYGSETYERIDNVPTKEKILNWAAIGAGAVLSVHSLIKRLTVGSLGGQILNAGEQALGAALLGLGAGKGFADNLKYNLLN